MTAIHNYGTIERQAKIADDYARARSWQVRDVPPASAVEYAERIQELLSDFQNAVAVPAAAGDLIVAAKIMLERLKDAAIGPERT